MSHHRTSGQTAGHAVRYSPRHSPRQGKQEKKQGMVNTILRDRNQAIKPLLAKCGSMDGGELDFAITQSLNTKLSQRVQSGGYKYATLAEVQSLFEILDTDGDGYVTFMELRTWLRTVVGDIRIDQEFIDNLEHTIFEAGNGRINPLYFHSLLCHGPVAKLLHELENQLKAQRSKSDIAAVDRNFVIGRCQWRTERDDAFKTLPFSMVYLVIFLAMVITHLNLWERQMLERGMVSHVAEWGFSYHGPYLHEHVPNVDNIYIWLETSAMQFAFDFCNKEKDKLVREDFCEKAPRNMLISDILLKQNRRDGQVWQHWLMDSAHWVPDLVVIGPRSYHDALCTPEALAFNKSGCQNIVGPDTCVAFGTDHLGTYCLDGSTGPLAVDNQLLFDSRCVCCGGYADVGKLNTGINKCPDWYTPTTTTTGIVTTATSTTATTTTEHHYHSAYEDVLKRIAQLREEHWLGRMTKDLALEFSTYNEAVRMFSVFQVRITIDEFGKIEFFDYSWCLPADPYPERWVLVLDGAYLVLLIIPLQAEVKELYRAIAHRGFSGFVEYWGIWNAVDWCQILCGFSLGILWVVFCYRVYEPSIQSLLDNYKLKPAVVKLKTENLHTIYNDLMDVVYVYRLLHGFMAANIVAIMSKFAKAFKCNSWLNLVSATCIRAGIDVFHFMVVFSSVYCGFSLCGHIGLGNDMMAFNTFGASFNTAFYCLLGDFAWYSDLSYVEVPLGSGTPYTLVAVWFWSFMIFTTLFMLNMLLTIIVEMYIYCRDEIRAEPDAPSIIEQTRRFFHRRRRYMAGGWIPLIQIYERLIADDPAHPEAIVTTKSLMHAFPHMKRDQADFLLSWWMKDLDAEAKCNAADDVYQQLKDMDPLLRMVGEQVHALHIGVLHCAHKIDNLQNAKGQKEQINLPRPVQDMIAYDDVAKTLDKQLRVMKELCDQFGKQQECTQRLAEALKELTRVGNMPTSSR